MPKYGLSETEFISVLESMSDDQLRLAMDSCDDCATQFELDAARAAATAQHYRNREAAIVHELDLRTSADLERS